jgi:uncharacterized protein
VSEATGIAGRLEADMRDALRAGERDRLRVIRRARSTLKNAEIAKGGALDDAAAGAALRGLAKQHRESIAQFEAGGRDDLVAQERAELAIIEAYLPQQLDEAAVAPLVSEAIAAEGATGPSDLGRVMKAAMARVQGRADGKLVRAVAQRLLEERS